MLTFHSLLDQIALTAIGSKRERASAQPLSGREPTVFLTGLVSPIASVLRCTQFHLAA